MSIDGVVNDGPGAGGLLRWHLSGAIPDKFHLELHPTMILSKGRLFTAFEGA